MRYLSYLLTVAHLSWATWGICSRWLISPEQPEGFAHSRSFVLSNLSQSLIWSERFEQMSEWAMSEWANSQPWTYDLMNIFWHIWKWCNVMRQQMYKKRSDALSSWCGNANTSKQLGRVPSSAVYSILLPCICVFQKLTDCNPYCSLVHIL